MAPFIILLVLALLAVPFFAMAAFIRANRANARLEVLAARLNVLEREVVLLRKRLAGSEEVREPEPVRQPEPMKEAEPERAAGPVPPMPVKPSEPVPPILPPVPKAETPAAIPASMSEPVLASAAAPPPEPSPAVSAPPLPSRPPARPAMAAIPVMPARPERPAINWEQFMGAKLFAWVGGLALFLGVAFFVKYSFEHDLIPAEIRVAIGFALGIGLLIGGVAMKKKAYAVTAQTLCSSGTLILYASTFACHGFYHFAFFGVVPTFLLMALITGVAFLLAVRLDAPVVAVLGMLGGFLTPLLLATGEDRPLGLFGYLALLDAGVLAVALNRRWNYLAPLAALGTVLMEIGWASRFFEHGEYFLGQRVLVPMGIALGFLLLFLAATWRARRRGWADSALTGATMLLVMAAFGFAMYLLRFEALGARPLLIFGYVFLIALATLALAFLHERSQPEQTWNLPAILAAGGAAAIEVNWAAQSFAAGGFSRGNGVLLPMGISLVFIGLFFAATLLARWCGREDRTLPRTTLLLVAVAFGYGLFFLGFEPLGARPGLLFGYVFAIAVAALGLAFLPAREPRPWNGYALFGALGAAVLQFAWTALFFVRGQFSEGNKVLIPMAVEIAFIALFLGAAWWAKRRGTRDRTCALLATGLAAGALLFGWYLLFFPGTGGRPALLFTYFFVVDLAVLGVVLLEGTLAVSQPLAGLAVFAALGIWTQRWMADSLLNTALALYLIFAIFHAVVPLVLRRVRATAPTPAWCHCFPVLALLLAIGPMLQSSALSFLVWPFVLLVDVLAVIVAVLTAALLPILLVLVLTLVVAGAWIAQIPANLTGLPTSLWMLGGFAVFFALAGVWASRRVLKPGATIGGRLPPEALGKLLPACAAVLPYVLLIMVVARLPLANPSPVFGLALLLSALLLGVTLLLGVEALPLVGLLSTLALEHAWHSRQFEPAHAVVPLLWYLGFYALFTAFPFVFRRRCSGSSLPWAAAALAGPLHFRLVHQLVQTAWPNQAMGLLPAAMAVPALLAVVVLVRTPPASATLRTSQLAWFGGVALFFITLIFPIQFDRQWLTIGWALEGAALCWLYHRVVHPGLRAVGVALLAVSFARLALNPAVLDYHPRGTTAIFNWFLYAYSAVALSLFAGARLLRAPRDRVFGLRVPPWLDAMGTLLAFLLVNIEIADYFTEPGARVVTLSFSGNLARDMSYSIAWSFFALLLVSLGIRKRNAAIRRAGLALLGVTLLKLFFHDLSQLSQLYRIAALMIVAVVAMLASFLYQRSFPPSKKIMTPSLLRPFRKQAALLTLFALAAKALALSPQEWRFRQKLEVPAAGLVRVEIPGATLDAARPGLEDLRLLDSAGLEVAYFVEQPEPQPAAQRPPRSFRTSVERGFSVITIETGIDTPIAALTLESPASLFMKLVQVEGSVDGEKWTPLAEPRAILRLPNGVAQLETKFPAKVWKFFRVLVDDHRSMPVPFTGALLLGERVEAPVAEVKAEIRSRDESPGVTRLAVDLGASNLRVAHLTLETSDPLFTRTVTVAVPQIVEEDIREQAIAHGAVHRVAVDDNVAERLDVRLEKQVEARELLLLIQNQDSPPLTITGVRATIRSARLVFVAREPGAYRLLSGNSQCAAPRYDLTPMADRLKNAAAATATIAEREGNPDFQTAETLPGVGESAAALDVSGWKFRREVQAGKGGVLQLEPDLDVLAQAQRGLGDLRVVRGGRQIPYLLERTSIQRAIALPVTLANDPRRPRLSRWSLALPKTGLPLTRLVCASATPLFERELRLWEEVPDAQGGKMVQELGRVSWQHTPEHPAREAVIEFSQPPVTETLLLETDDADNPPIDLARPRAYHPVTRVVFKTAPGATEPLGLLYGNAHAQPPRYDLRLVAAQLLGAEKSIATLGPETPGTQPHKQEIQNAGGYGGVVFWGALVVVVAGLLLVLAKMLPKPPDAAP